MKPSHSKREIVRLARAIQRPPYLPWFHASSASLIVWLAA